MAPSTQTLVDYILLIAGPKEGAQLVVLPFCRAQPLIPSDQRAQLAVLPDLGPKSYHANHGAHSTTTMLKNKKSVTRGKLRNSQIH